MPKPKKIKLILPMPEEGKPEDSMIAIQFDTRISHPMYYNTHDEIIFADSVSPGEFPEVEERAKWMFRVLTEAMGANNGGG